MTREQYVKSRLDEEKLKEIAKATGGFYVHLEGGPATAKAIIEQGLEEDAGARIRVARNAADRTLRMAAGGRESCC